MRHKKSQPKQAQEAVYVYRGVHAKHPMREAALKGTVVPGDPAGEITPEEHNMLDESSISPFTSWTYSMALAKSFANSRGPGGVLLRSIKNEPKPGDHWSWVDSPDWHQEQEVLLKGVRMGVEVLRS